MSRRVISFGVLLVAVSLVAAACAPAAPPPAPTAAPTEVPPTEVPAPEMKDIVDTAVAAGSFTTLATALTEAGLVDTLKGPGPFTVFAPTDEAFAKLPAGTVEDLLKPENRDKLVDILTFHVVSGKVMAADVVNLTEAKTVQGAMLPIKVDGDTVMVGDATVTATDIEASNGVISEPYTDYKAIARRHEHPFLAGEGDNRVLVRNDPAEIEAMVRRMVDTAGLSGGYMMCIGNHIPWNVPAQAIQRYIECSRRLARR